MKFEYILSRLLIVEIAIIKKEIYTTFSLYDKFSRLIQSISFKIFKFSLLKL